MGLDASPDQARPSFGSCQIINRTGGSLEMPPHPQVYVQLSGLSDSSRGKVLVSQQKPGSTARKTGRLEIHEAPTNWSRRAVGAEPDVRETGAWNGKGSADPPTQRGGKPAATNCCSARSTISHPSLVTPTWFLGWKELPRHVCLLMLRRKPRVLLWKYGVH